MHKNQQSLLKEYGTKLDQYRSIHTCDGIQDQEYFNTFLKQLVDSIIRTRYFNILLRRGVASNNCLDPSISKFHPIRAAIYHKQERNINEAIWLCFLYAHFGKSAQAGWGLIKGFYGSLGEGSIWNWERVVNDMGSVKYWIASNYEALKASGNFGNHSKYKSLKPGHTDIAISSFVQWIQDNQGFEKLLAAYKIKSQSTGELLFDIFYQEMKTKVHTFGRMGVFDFLCTIGKLELAEVVPDKMYVAEATGPKPGAKLFFTGSENGTFSNSEIEQRTKDLSNFLGLYFGMQVLEDAFCNWQKSPQSYVKFTA